MEGEVEMMQLQTKRCLDHQGLEGAGNREQGT